MSQEKTEEIEEEKNHGREGRRDEIGKGGGLVTALSTITKYMTKAT